MITNIIIQSCIPAIRFANREQQATCPQFSCFALSSNETRFQWKSRTIFDPNLKIQKIVGILK